MNIKDFVAAARSETRAAPALRESPLSQYFPNMATKEKHIIEKQGDRVVAITTSYTNPHASSQTAFYLIISRIKTTDVHSYTNKLKKETPLYL